MAALTAALLAGLALLQPGAAWAQTPAAPPAPAWTLAGKSAGEAGDYAAALALTDPAAQGPALESFVDQYPASRLKTEALERASAAYLVARDLDKVEALSGRLLVLEPDNARALAMAVFVLRAKADAAPAPQAEVLIDEAAADARHGLAVLGHWRPRDDVSDSDANAIRSEMTATFHGALGYRALMREDYASAKADYLAAVRADPAGLDDVYQLAVAMLQADPIDPAGFWWAARAQDLAVTAGDDHARAAIEAYAKRRYALFHGSEEGWEALLTRAGTGLTPPADFTCVAPAPSAAAVAVQAVHDSPVSSLDFSDWEFILAQHDASPANRAAADKVWANIVALQSRGLRMKFQVKVVAAGPTGLDGVIIDNGVEADSCRPACPAEPRPRRTPRRLERPRPDRRCR